MTQLIKKNGTEFPTMFSDFFETGKLFPTDWLERDWTNWMPAANIVEKGKEFKIDLSIPGMKKEEIHVKVEDDMLTITGEHKEENREEKNNFTRKEFHYGSFKRSFRLPSEVKEDSIEAKFDNGLLMLKIPKSEMAIEKPKKEIKVK